MLSRSAPTLQAGKLTQRQREKKETNTQRQINRQILIQTKTKTKALCTGRTVFQFGKKWIRFCWDNPLSFHLKRQMVILVGLIFAPFQPSERIFICQPGERRRRSMNSIKILSSPFTSSDFCFSFSDFSFPFSVFFSARWILSRSCLRLSPPLISVFWFLFFPFTSNLSIWFSFVTNSMMNSFLVYNTLTLTLENPFRLFCLISALIMKILQHFTMFFIPDSFCEWGRVNLYLKNFQYLAVSCI